MRVIIPAAGIGKRLRPHTHTVPKVLLRLAGKPILGHIMDLLENISVSELVFVVGYKADKVREYIENEYSRYNLRFVYQKKREGLGHAIYSTGKTDEDTLIILGDTLFRADLKSILQQRGNMIGVKQVDDPRRFGVVELDSDGNIKKLIEKPQNPSSNLAVVGIYYISDFRDLYNSLEYIIKNNIRTSGEFQLTDALEDMVKNNFKFSVFEIDQWLDCGKRETMLETQKILLDEKTRKYEIPGSVIINPVSISSDAVIENSVVGPYVDVANGSKIKNTIISNSILGKNSIVENAILDYSIIGDNAVYITKSQNVNIGDSSEVLSFYKKEN